MCKRGRETVVPPGHGRETVVVAVSWLPPAAIGGDLRSGGGSGGQPRERPQAASGAPPRDSQLRASQGRRGARRAAGAGSVPAAAGAAGMARPRMALARSRAGLMS